MDFRQTKTILDRHATRRQDATQAVYLRPLGDRGLHQVQIGSAMVEATSTGRITLKRGTVVTVVSAKGGRYRKILTGAPSGRQGASAYPSTTVYATRPLTAAEAALVLPPPEDFPDLPPGFVEVLGSWGRYGTYAHGNASPAWVVGRTVQAQNAATGLPHETAIADPLPITASVTGPGPVLHSGQPHNAANTPYVPSQTNPPEAGQWKFFNQGPVGTTVMDIPITHVSPEWLIYNDGGVHAAFLRYSASAQVLAFGVFDGPTQEAFVNFNGTLNQSIYSVDVDEAWEQIRPL